MGLKWRGLQAMQRTLARMGRDMDRAIGAALYQEALEIQRESQKQCPIEFGPLRRSAYVNPPQYGPSGPSVEIGYGTDYAPYVHERLDLRHKAPTKAKFLEDPIKAAKKGWRKRVEARAWSAFEKRRFGFDRRVGGGE